MGSEASTGDAPARRPHKPNPDEALVPDVALRFWPEQADEIAAFGAAARACLILVGPGIEPPSVLAGTHEWLRIPADELEVSRRVEALAARARHPA